MAKDSKADIINEAQKQFSKGNFKKAAELYEKVIKEDPPSRMKLAMVYQKMGDNGKALDQYYQMSRFYTKGGFYSKSVAVLKQALQLAPDKIEMHEELADLYSKLGLFSEAFDSYKRVVATYERDKNVVKAIETIQKMVDLDPEKLSIRVKLAELYMESGKKDEADREFQALADELRSDDRMEDLTTLYERWQNFNKALPEIPKALAEIYYNLREYKKAVRHFRTLIEMDSESAQSPEIRLSLGRSLQYAGDTGAAETELDWVIKAYKSQGNGPAAASIQKELDALRGVATPEPAKPKIKEIVETAPPPKAQPQAEPKPAPKIEVEEELTLDDEPEDEIALDEDEEDDGLSLDMDLGDESEPEPARAQQESQTVSNGRPQPAPVPGDLPAAYAKAFTEVDIYIKYGLKDKAVDHLTALVDEDPACAALYHKISDIRLKYDEREEACKILHRYGFWAASQGLIEEARQTISRIRGVDEAFAPVGEIENMLGVLEARMGGGAPVSGPSIEMDAEPDLDIEIEVPAPAKAEAEIDIALDEGEAEPPEDTLDIGMDFAEEEPEPEPAPPMEIDLGEREEIAPAIPPEETEEEDGIRLNLDLDEEESAGISLDIGEPEPEVAEAEPEPEPEIEPEPEPELAAAAPVEEEEDDGFDAALDALDAAPVAVEDEAAEVVMEAAPVVEEKPAPPAPRPVKPAPKPQPTFKDVSEELSELDFYLDKGLDEEALELLTDLLKKNPGHPDVLSKFALLGEDPPEQYATPPESSEAVEEEGEEVADGFDLAAALAEDLGDDEAAVPAGDYAENLDKKTRIVADGISEKDVEAHFDLGLAYREMDMLEEAIKEFELCKQSPTKRIEAMTQIGQLHSQMGRTEEAIMVLESVLESSGATTSQKAGINIQLGEILEQSGDPESALQRYKQAQALDPSFGDLARRIAALEKPGGKKKVSFL